MSSNRPLVQIEHLRVNYGDVEALRGVDLTLRRGRITALLGTNGAGKSSLVRALVGLEPDVSGQVRFDTEDDPRRILGYCPQELDLWMDLTVREQIVMMGELFGLKRVDATRRADELIGELELRDKANARAAHLSGGMKRRLSIAMALVHDPELLVLDEAEVGLDAQTRIMLRAYLKGLARDRDKAILIASHDIAEVEKLADDVMILDSGRCVASGELHDLIRHQGGALSLEDVFVVTTERATA